MINPLNTLLWSGWDQLAKVIARSYIVGPELNDALKVRRRLAPMPTTICYWNTEFESPQQVTAAYIRALVALEKEHSDATVSIKAPAIGFDRSLWKQILESSRINRVNLHFDSLAPEAADKTFAMIDEAIAQHPELGCTLPGRWRRSPIDADWAIRQKLHVRVVKGQWADPVTPELDLREGFLALIDRLAGRARYVAVATHDAPLAQAALERLLKAKTPCGLELLYGLPMKPALQAAKAAGVATRVYLPYGHGWAPYTLSQIRKNPRILWWVVRDLCAFGSRFERA